MGKHNKHAVIIRKEVDPILNPGQQEVVKQIKRKGYSPVPINGLDEAISYFILIKDPPAVVISEFSLRELNRGYPIIFEQNIGNIVHLGMTPYIAKAKNGYIKAGVSKKRVQKKIMINEHEHNFIDWNKMLQELEM